MNVSPVLNFSNKNSNLIKSSGPKCNSFSQKVNFTGAQYPSGYYYDTEIATAFKYLNHSDDTWRATAHDNLMDGQNFFKYVFGGGSEEIDRHLNEVAKLRKDLQTQARQIEIEKQRKIDLDRERREIERQRQIERDAQDARDLIEHKIQLKLKPAKTQMTDDFLTLTKLAKNNSEIQVPNGIMIENSNKDLAKKFVDWTLSQDEVNAKKLNIGNKSHDDIISELKNVMNQSSENYGKTGKRTLLYIDSFDKIASQKDENKRMVAVFKNIMCSCSEKYKCTVLINVLKDKISAIDPILLVDSRIQSKIRI